MNHKTMRIGVPLVICAPSGAGKTTLIKRLLQEFNRFAYSVSYTTRLPRKGETHGQDYFFVSREDFVSLADKGFFAEWAEVHGNMYGTPLSGVQEHLAAGRDVLFDVDVQGARQLKEGELPATFVFVLPPSGATLRARLESRGTDSPEIIAHRLNNAPEEIMEARWFDAWVINDDLDTAYDELRAIYMAATCKPRTRPGLVDKMLTEWQK